MKRRSGRKPTPCASSYRKPSTRTADITSRTSERATWPATIVLRPHRRRLPPLSASVAFSAGTRSGRVIRSAGASPNNSVLPTETSSVKSKTLVSTVVAIDHPKSLGNGMLAKNSAPASATTMPASPPATATTRFSSRSCRTSAPRLAPIARRTAISRERARARLSSRPATLAQATAKTARASRPSIMTMAAVGGDCWTRSWNSVCTWIRRDAFALRMQLLDPGRDHRDVGSCLLHADARSQPSPHREPCDVAAMQIVLSQAGRHGQRKIHRRMSLNARESGRGDADDRELDPVQSDSGAENRRAGAELADPEIVTEHRHGIPALGLVLVRAESSAERRFHAQHAEEVARNKLAEFDAGQRSCAGAETERCGGEGHQPLEAAIAVAEVGVVRKRERCIDAHRRRSFGF